MNKRTFVLSNDRDKHNVRTFIDRLELTEDVQVTFSKKENKRSVAQNSLYWLFLNELESNTGHRSYQWHEYFKRKLLPGIVEHDVFNIMGETIQAELTTRNLNTKQFTDYLNLIEEFTLNEVGITFPHPEDLYYKAIGMA